MKISNKKNKLIFFITNLFVIITDILYAFIQGAPILVE